MKTAFIRGLCLAAALLLMLAASGCTAVNITGSVTGMGQERGTGPIETYTFPAGDIHTLDIAANLEVVYSDRLSDTVTVEIQSNLMDLMAVSYENGVLTANSRKDFVYDNKMTGKLYVGAPNLHSVYVGGALTMQDADPITGDSFYMEISGAGAVRLDLQVEDLTIIVSGAGSLDLSGRADKAELSIFGAGSISGKDLQTRIADVSINGAGSADISCSQELTAQIGGTGSLTYYGSPQVTRNVFGAGAVSKG